MKKLLTLFLATLMILSCTLAFTSCGGGNDDLYFGKEYIASSAQIDLLTKLNAKNIDVAVMDSIMAGYYMSQDTTYANSLQIVEGLTLSTEQYGIGCRKGSGLTKYINYSLIELAKSGKVAELAEKYGIASEICIDTTLTVDTTLTDAEKVDIQYLSQRGKFIVGYTLFAPIAYEENGELIGFDIELAKAVADFMQIPVEFQRIEWSAKEALLEGKSIDCIWNGMTITDDRIANMEMSIPYLNNKQVAVIRKEDADKYKTTEDMAKAIVSAEAGSAGEGVIVKPKEEQ